MDRTSEDILIAVLPPRALVEGCAVRSPRASRSAPLSLLPLGHSVNGNNESQFHFFFGERVDSDLKNAVTVAACTAPELELLVARIYHNKFSHTTHLHLYDPISRILSRA